MVQSILRQKLEEVLLREDSWVRCLLQDPRSWPLYCKGGLEAILRDLLIVELSAVLTDSQWIVTGERQRLDIVFYEKDQLSSPSRESISCALVHAIELKFNYLDQSSEFGRASKSINKLLPALRNQKTGGDVSIDGLVFMCDAARLDTIKAKLASRYVKQPTKEQLTDRSSSGKSISAALTELNEGYSFRELVGYKCQFLDGGGVASVRAFVTW